MLRAGRAGHRRADRAAARGARARRDGGDDAPATVRARPAGHRQPQPGQGARDRRAARALRRRGRSPPPRSACPSRRRPATTFAANAELKARAAATARGLPALADDSGLVVAALGGAPGIYSARWAGPDAGFRASRWRGSSASCGRATPTAARYFVCALALAWPDGHCESVRGPGRRRTWSGRRAATAASATIRSSCPTATTLTFGEMDPAAKHAISHRADAFRKLVGALLRPMSDASAIRRAAIGGFGALHPLAVLPGRNAPIATSTAMSASAIDEARWRDGAAAPSSTTTPAQTPGRAARPASSSAAARRR